MLNIANLSLLYTELLGKLEQKKSLNGFQTAFLYSFIFSSCIIKREFTLLHTRYKGKCQSLWCSIKAPAGWEKKKLYIWL